MSLQLSISLCQTCNCQSLQFSEDTGVYDVTANPTGWGTPNKSLGDVSGATLTITLSDASVYTIDIYTNSGGQFPTSDDTRVYSIVNEDIGYVTGDKIPDQIITVKYTVTFSDDTTSSAIIYKALYCNAKCCVDGMLKDIDFTCDCSKRAIYNYIQAKVLYNAMIASAECNNVIEFNSMLSMVNKMCLNSDCGCQ